MFTFPEVLTRDSIAVFPDDEDPNLFYAIQTRPRLRVDNGVPVFRALFWTDEGDGAPGSVAGLKGATVHFDVNLAIDQKDLDDLSDVITKSGYQERRRQILLEAERDRLQRQARALGEDPEAVRPKVPDVGAVRFGSVKYTDGNVTLLEEKSGELVAWSSAGGPPSMLGDNNAAFAMRLSAEGADVWYRALEQNAASIGVRFELTTEARLPSLEIHIWAGSHQKVDVERAAQRTIDNEDQGCSDADVEHIDVTKIAQKAEEEGLVNIEIIKGSAEISDEHVSQLRNAALAMMTDRIKEILMHRVQGMTPEERKSSLLQTVTDEVNSFAELRLTQRDVIPWKLNPQATITDFLGKLSADVRKGMLALIDLSDPVVSTLEVPITVSAKWDSDPPTTQVTLEVAYTAAGPEAREGFQFDKSKGAASYHHRRVKGDRGLVRYSAQAFVLGSDTPIKLPGGETNGPIHLEVPDLGSFNLKWRPHANIFTLKNAATITNVTLDYAYQQEGHPDYQTGTLSLQKEQATDGISRKFNVKGRVDAPVRFRPRYTRGFDQSVMEGAWQQMWVAAGTTETVEVPSPWRDSLRVTAAIPPGTPGLVRAEVKIEYHDTKNGFDNQGTMILTADADANWQGTAEVIQIDKTQQRFTYQYRVWGKDQLATSTKVQAEGDQDLVLPVLAVRIRGTHLGLGTAYDSAAIRIRYEDAEHGLVVTRDDAELTKDQPEIVFLIPRIDATKDKYTYQVTLFPRTGQPIVQPVAEGQGAFLVLTPP